MTLSEFPQCFARPELAPLVLSPSLDWYAGISSTTRFRSEHATGSTIRQARFLSICAKDEGALDLGRGRAKSRRRGTT